MSDSLIRRLSDLPDAEPDMMRSERIRTRCRARLERDARSSLLSRLGPMQEQALSLWQPSIAVLALLYMAAVIRFALEVYRLA